MAGSWEAIAEPGCSGAGRLVQRSGAGRWCIGDWELLVRCSGDLAVGVGCRGSSCRPAGVAGGEHWNRGGRPRVAGGGASTAGRRRRRMNLLGLFHIHGEETKRYVYIMAEVGNLLSHKRSNGCALQM